jgi:hypothetical protein
VLTAAIVRSTRTAGKLWSNRLKRSCGHRWLTMTSRLNAHASDSVSEQGTQHWRSPSSHRMNVGHWPGRCRRALGDRLLSFVRSDPEATLSTYFEDYATGDDTALAFVLGHPLKSISAAVTLRRLPRVDAVLTDSVEGAAVARGLAQRSALGRTLTNGATSVLILPREPADYATGASKQTLRRKVRAAHKQGVTWKEVEDPQEQRRLLALANRQEREHHLELYRIACPDNGRLMTYRLWLAAYSREGRPLLLSVTPFDGEWAVLTYFRTLGVGPEYSDARYLMSQVLAEHLASRGVRYLADEGSPIGLPSGLRHFQRMLGYRLLRVRIIRQSEGRSTAQLTGSEAQAS